MLSRMSGAIFRRGGQKAEVYGTPGELQTSTAHLETKLAELQTIWSASLTAAAQSLAVWQPDHQAAEVTIERGHVLQRMGYRRTKKLYIHAEEAVYLVSRGSLLLTVIDTQGQQQLLSLQEATHLMESAGVSVAQYQAYCHLMRAGFIVARHPATWVVDDDAKPSQQQEQGRQVQQQPRPETTAVAELSKTPKHVMQDVPKVLTDDVDCTDLPAPLKRARLSAEVDQDATKQVHMHWWPAASQTCAWSSAADEAPDDLARFAVVVDSVGKSDRLLPKLHMFPSIQHAANNELHVPDNLKLVYDVLKPNKHFSKGRPDDPRLVVCLSTCTFAPSLSVIQHLQQQAHPLPLQFAKVAGGEVSFHGIQNWS